MSNNENTNEAKFKEQDESVDNQTNRTANNHMEEGNANAVTMAIQGDEKELKENLGGSTNLSLDQLKEDDGQPADKND